MKKNMIRFKAWYRLQVLLCFGLCMCNMAGSTAASRVDVDTTIYMAADKVPQFEGNMKQWMVENIRYPQVAWDNNITGKVIVSFVVERDGRISHVEILRGVHEVLDAEALRVFSLMPNWKPAEIKGEAVRFRLSFPLVFNIERDVAEAYTYEDFVAMLDEASKIPLEDIQEEKDPAVLRMFVDQRRIFQNDAGAYDAFFRSVNGNVSWSAPELARRLDLSKEQQKKLADVHAWVRQKRKELGESVKRTNFIERSAALAPVLTHLRILEEAKVKECMEPVQHIMYFHELLDHRMLVHQQDGQEPCSCKCFFHLFVPMLENSGLQYWVARNVRYPEVAQERNIQGKVMVGFMVNEDGRVSNVNVVQSVDPSLDQESLRVFKNLPSFVPLICPIHKRKISVHYTAPINFMLQ